MAIYHFSAKVISRGNGSSAVAAAAYRAAERLHDEHLDRAHDYTNKAGVEHSEILLPEGAPERWQDRATLWNEVEAREPQKNSQLAREIEFSIPREMNQADGIGLARDFVQREFVDRGMVADLNVHWDIGADGLAKPHAHVMLTMRDVTPEGFGSKHREWNDRALLEGWREGWATHVNQRLAELGIDASIDHRTLAAQGIALEPQNKLGPAGMRREDRGEDAERAVEHREIARRNGEKIIAEPGVALDAITRQQSTFTEHDLARFVHRHTDDKDQFDRAISAVKSSRELVALGVDGRGRERFSTREMLGCEQRLEQSAQSLGMRRGHKVTAATLDRAVAAAEVQKPAPGTPREVGLDIAVNVDDSVSMTRVDHRASTAAVQAINAAETRGLVLGGEQRDAVAHITRGQDLSLVVGYAGTGKSAMLGVAREAWEASGYQVRGAALSGIAAESLEAGSGIEARTIASLEHGWGQGRDLLTARDVLVIDEAGMIGSRQMDRVLLAAEQAGAKVVLVGDAEQLQAIEAGAAFRALTERHGAAEITQIRRQREDWQRNATRELATGRTGEALDRYEGAGMVQGHATREAAREAVVAGWDGVRQVHPEASQVMLAHTRADVAELNILARARMRDAGALGDEEVLQTERGPRAFAPGDRVMFLKNERSMGVKNGSLGTVKEISSGGLAVRLDGADQRQVRFDLKDYAEIDHGYASTIHKSQGVTVDHGHVLATDGLDRHGAYVGMSRHREALSVHYGIDDFKDRAALTRTLSRERAKDTTLDYPLERTFADRRGIEVPAEMQRPAAKQSIFDGLDLRLKTPVRDVPKASMFDGLELPMPAKRERSAKGPAVGGSPTDRAEVQRSMKRYTAAWADAERMGAMELPILPHQKIEMKAAREALDGVVPEAAKDLRAAFVRTAGLAARGATPEGMGEVKKAASLERQVRLDPAVRAERFVQDWTGLQAEYGRVKELPRWDDKRQAVEKSLKVMVDGLQRDPQVDSLLRNRRLELGLGKARQVEGLSISAELVKALTPGRTLGIGR